MSALKWWQKAVFYQIYPRSFADGNGDGIGDLAGMTARLDMLKELGVDALWLSPHYPSPMEDCGYDISSYEDVAPEYGTLDEFRNFLNEAHRRGMRVILDLVLNHTSDQHDWFRESRSSRDNPKRDWYVWRDGKNGGPPNNWYSTFGGPAWEYDAMTDAYYYHFFFKGQPDLNWRNPEVKAAMFDAARFWLDMGVDGFRLDAIGTIFEDPAMLDHQASLTLEDHYRFSRQARTAGEWLKASELWEEIFHYQHDQPGMHELMKELRAVVDEYEERVLVGETDDISYYGSGDDELHLVFNFPLIRTNRLTPDWVRANQDVRLAALPPGAWPCNTLGNHDSPRVFSAFGDGVHDEELARLHLALLLTVKGTPFLYNGEEIGMRDYLILDMSKHRDPLGPRAYALELKLMGSTPEAAADFAARAGRDKGRTPYQWVNAGQAGFCPEDVEPWLPVNPNYAQGVNFEEQARSDGSLLRFYQAMLKMRRENSALKGGEYLPANEMDEGTLVFWRQDEQQTCGVGLNFTLEPRRVRLGGRQVIFSSAGRTGEVGSEVELEAFEALVVRV